MILPMFGFLLALLVIGGLAAIVAVGDPAHARLALYIGFALLFSGLGALLLSITLALPGELLFDSHALAGYGFFGGYVLGGLGGAGIGLFTAVRRRQRIESQMQE